MYHIEPMTTEYANAISDWTYPDEYGIYSFENSDDTIAELMNGEYFACTDMDNTLTGYFCFGKSAQIPTVEDTVFSTDMPDIGLGLCPALCGQQLGAAFMKSGLEYAREKFCTPNIRLTVACFNHRAIKLYTKLGFTCQYKVHHRKTQLGFYIMLYTAMH